MRRAICLLLLLGSFLVSPGAVGAAGDFSPGDAFADVRALAGGIGPRPAGSANDRQAARFVEDRFVALGYEVELQPFALPQGGRSRNVVASVGDMPASLIVGAHLDTVRDSPGANDNASGVAVLLELAETLAGSEAAGEVTLVAFGAEEYQPGGVHHIGSAVYVRRMLSEERDALRAMVSADMVGKRGSFIVGRLAGTPRGAARLLAQAVEDANIEVHVRALGDISDHGPFARAGLPAAFLWTGDEPNHHEPTDVVANVDRRALGRAGRVLVSLARLVAG